MKGLIISLIIFSTILFPIIFITSESTERTTFLELKDNWTFRQVNKGDWMPAIVPGTVHQDLLTNNKIDDPFYKDNEKKLQWIDKEDWEYETVFDIDGSFASKDNIDLIFQGLDTYADIYLNDKLIKKTDNMFVAYTVPVQKLLRRGKNKLRVYFHSPVKTGMAKLQKSPYLIPAANELAPDHKKTSVFTRKAPYHYGWDWGPRLVTSGIWKPVYLEGWNVAKISGTFHELQKLFSHKAEYITDLQIVVDRKGIYEIELLIDSKPEVLKFIKLKKGLNKLKLSFDIENPKLWWCNGLGSQPLYEITTKVKFKGNVIDQNTKKIGVRTIEVVQQPDSAGKTFKIRLNGVDVFIKGSNYIPADNFTPRVTTDRYKKVIKAAKDAHMNMLRVWGGAIYESDEFYDLCDENGIMIWQDFMFACAMTPGDQDHLDNLKLEFEDNVKRLRRHSSLALWCGNNENMVMWYGWGVQKRYNLSATDSADQMKTYLKIFYDLIPNTIRKYDSTRYYWPSSPGGGYKYNELQGPGSGDVHDWWIWFGKATDKELLSRKQRFISEYGLQSYPEMKTIKTFSTSEDWAYDSKLFDFKQRSEMPWIGKDAKGNTFNGNDMIAWYVNYFYKQPKSFDHFVYLSQLMQADQLRKIIEGHRTHKPYCWGSMYWQIDDCWPTVSWSTIDYYYRWKAGHYFVKKAYQPIAVSPTVNDGNIQIHVLSDKREGVDAVLHYSLMDFAGRVLIEKDSAVFIPANSTSKCLTQSLKSMVGKEDPKKLLLLVTIKEKDEMLADNVLYFDLPKNLDLPLVNIIKRVTVTKTGADIELRSDTLAKNIYLYNDLNDGFFSDNYFDLIPGQTVKVTFTSTEDLSKFESGLRIRTLRDTY